jgi:drug/metabolite transporter (DMT)-like permease
MFTSYTLSKPHQVDTHSSRSIRHFKALYTIGWMLLWSLSFTTSMAMAKFISESLPNSVIVFLRCSFGLMFFLPFAAKEVKQQGIQVLKVQQPLLYILRIILVSCAMGCTYYAYRNLPLATASAIGFSSPLFTTLLGVLFLKNRINGRKSFCILLGYVGVLVVVGPFSLELNSAESVAILANLLASCAIILLKKLCVTESNTRILFYTNSATVLLSGASAVLMWQLPSWQDAGLLALIGISSTLSQVFYAQALRGAEPYFVAPLEYNRLLFAVLMGYWLFAEIPTYTVLMGAGLIIIANLYLSFLEFKK